MCLYDDLANRSIKHSAIRRAAPGLPICRTPFSAVTCSSYGFDISAGCTAESLGVNRSQKCETDGRVHILILLTPIKDIEGLAQKAELSFFYSI